MRFGMARTLYATQPETLKTQHDAPPSTTVRAATPADARAMWTMAKESGALDLNSPYAYLLAGHHFGSTSVVAEDDGGNVVGFVMAYPPPTAPHQVFVWQVAVDPSQRGTGIAHRMLNEVIDLAVSGHGVTTMTATVTPSNEASRRLFQSVARSRDARFT